MKLTPAILEAAYDFLHVTQPFSKWNLPGGDEICFRVIRKLDTAASLYTNRNERPIISISEVRNGHIVTLLSSMAHEMIHLHEARCRIRSRGSEHHGMAFRAWAKIVCKIHGFDLTQFY